jgi:Uncharacterized conserved protein, contains double-stranded beta-helix domain
MIRINIKDISEQEEKSPKGKYHAFMKEISIALGRQPRSLDLARRHPFDVTVVRIPPGKAFGLYHTHAAQWEFYVVIAGMGNVRHEGGVTEVRPGDAFVFAPREAHQLMNGGTEDFVYYVIADNPLSDSCYYPDSQKWLVIQPTKDTLLKGREVEYYEGEE